MSADDPKFDDTEDFNVKHYLKANRMVNLHFSQIHQPSIITKQIPNAHETYCALPLQWWPNGDYVNVNDFFTTDFTPAFGDLDESDGIHKPRAYAIFGKHGAGKSALLHYLKYEWTMDDADDVPGIKDFDYVILINSTEINNYTSLPLMCKDLCFSHDPPALPSEYLFSKLVGLKILWLIDNFHEADENGKDLIREVLIQFTRSRVFFTCRWSQNEPLMLMLDDLEVKTAFFRLRPLADDQWKELVRKMVRAKSSDEQKINDVVSSFTADVQELVASVKNLYPNDVGMSLNVWIEELYPLVKGGASRSKMLSRLRRMMGLGDGDGDLV